MTVEIGFARAEELPAMANLLGQLFALESDFTPDPQRQLAGLQLIHAQPAHGRLFALRIDGRVAGMANLLITISTAEGAPVGLLEDLIVAPGRRRQGLGSRLLEHVSAWAAAQGIRRLTLLADADNAPALDFYARHGFAASAMCVRRRFL